MTLWATSQRYTRRTERVLHSCKSLGQHVGIGILVAPAVGKNDRDVPAAPGQLSVDLLVDADHGGVAYDEQSPRARDRFPVAADALQVPLNRPGGRRLHGNIVARSRAHCRHASLYPPPMIVLMIGCLAAMDGPCSR